MNSPARLRDKPSAKAIVSAYLAQIGRKGGMATAAGPSGRGTPRRKEIARDAARARHRNKAGPPLYQIKRYGGSLIISPHLPQILLDEMRYCSRKGAGEGFVGEWVNLYTITSETTLETHSGFLERIERLLRETGKTYILIEEGPALPIADCKRIAPRLTPAERVLAMRLLRSRVGGAVVVSPGQLPRIIHSLIRAFGARDTVVVTRDEATVDRLRLGLERMLAGSRTIGILAGSKADNGDVVVMTAASLPGGVVDPLDIRVLIFVDPPKKGREWITETIMFGVAKKFALLRPEHYPKPQRRILEAVFGPIVIANECMAAMHRQMEPIS